VVVNAEEPAHAGSSRFDEDVATNARIKPEAAA